MLFRNLLLIGMSLVLVLSGCSGSSEKKLPLIGVSVRVADQGKDYCKLEWKVTNNSNINATFRNGNIEQYEIMNMSTNKKYISEKNKLDIVLKKWR